MLDYLLSLFTSDDELRPQFCTPFKIGENVYATDTYTIIKIPVKWLNKKHNINEKAPKDLNNMFQNTPEPKFPQIDSTIDELASLLASVKWSYQRTLCPVCKGASETTCEHCGQSAPCKECNGTGETDEINFLKRKENEPVTVQFNDALYSPFVLEKLLIALMALQFRSPGRIYMYQKNLQSLFVTGEIEIILMQRYKS